VTGVAEAIPAPDLPLAGIRILELSTVVTAALAATLMSEQGATTIKVEPVGIGDTLRHLGTAREGVSAMFANCNRGKRSVALDLKRPEGQVIARDLARDADVLISNYRPGVLERLGLGAGTLRRDNPGLIHLSISGFGTDGPLAAAPAYDHVIQGLSGMTAMQGLDGEFAPIRTFVCDEVTAYTACQAATAALFQRSRTGQGQAIELSMLASAIYFLWPAAMAQHTFVGEGVRPLPALKETYRTYPTRDGFITMAPLTNRHWQGLFQATGRAALAEDPRFGSIAGRSVHLAELFDQFQDAFIDRSREAALRLLADLDIPCTACLTLEEVLTHPQVAAIGAIHTGQHPILGTLRAPTHPARFGGRPAPPLPALGPLGQHSRQVLRELGYDEAGIDRLAGEGVIAEAPG